MRLAFLCCHLTGTGHLVRTLALARAARDLGHAATVISGGRPLGHIEPEVLIVQLPPVVVRGLEFTTLRTPEGERVSADYMLRRGQALAEALETLRPDALVTELYPFGRRVLETEFRQAIVAARAANAACAVLASVRDIPEPKPHRLAETAARLAADYDGVLVHGDAAFLPLSTTWPLPADLCPMINHTGYVGAAMPSPAGPRRDTVVVAVGGGVLGRRLLEVAAEAAARSCRPWHLLVGGSDASERAAELAARAASNLTVEPARPEYRALLASAGCSVSLCGYNTAVELARCTTPALLVPSEEAGEREQLIRARRLAEHRGFRLIRLSELPPDRLARAAEALAAGPPRPPVPLAGDDGTAAIARIAQLVAAKARR
jgi:UDP-N-acetylglucosamine--N-acetylmuramyl-(pentapeptide) pyrophosphoryl-undecaprenol N-acetylglucosamine transferase